MGDVIPTGSPRQGALPEEYRTAVDDELHARIRAAKATLGDRVVVLGHFYQRDEVIQYADFVGDSFQLANAALTRPDAEAIVFCGVHFMAETADILSTPEQAVILPNLAAGCSMADMADESTVEECWEQLEEVFGTEPDADGRVPVIPVTYMNSSAALKAFCGEHGGIVCTSSNAKTVLEWAFERGQRVLFFPDQHLGRNTAKAMGVPLEQMPMWNPRKPLGGNDEQATRRLPGHPLARILLGAQALHRRPDRAGPRRLPRRPRDRAPRVPHGGRGRSGLRRVHRLHQEGHPGRARRHDVRDRHGDQHGAAARRRVPAAHHLLPGPRGLPLLDDVPDPPRLPRVGARGARRGPSRQPHHRGGRRRRRARGSRSSACSPPSRRPPARARRGRCAGA